MKRVILFVYNWRFSVVTCEVLNSFGSYPPKGIFSLYFLLNLILSQLVIWQYYSNFYYTQTKSSFSPNFIWIIGSFTRFRSPSVEGQTFFFNSTQFRSLTFSRVFKLLESEAALIRCQFVTLFLNSLLEI